MSMNQVHIVLKELVRRHDKVIRFEIQSYFRNEMDADDVYQEICIHIYHKLENSDETELNKWSSAAWARTIVKNKCLDILRKNQRDAKHSKDFGDDGAFEKAIDNSNYSDKPEISGDKSYKIIKIQELILQLSERDRRLITLRFFKKYAIKEIDEIMGIKNSSVYIERALVRLRALSGAEDFFELYDGYKFEE